MPNIIEGAVDTAKINPHRRTFDMRKKMSKSRRNKRKSSRTNSGDNVLKKVGALI